MGLQKLPTELISLVKWHVDDDDFESFALIDKRIYECSRERFTLHAEWISRYRDVAIMGGSSFGGQCQSVRDLLLLLVAEPRIGCYIRTLTLNATQDFRPLAGAALTQDVKHRLRTFVSKFSATSDDDFWTKPLGDYVESRVPWGQYIQRGRRCMEKFRGCGFSISVHDVPQPTAADGQESVR